jgi:hypothetical protein
VEEIIEELGEDTVGEPEKAADGELEDTGRELQYRRRQLEN